MDALRYKILIILIIISAVVAICQVSAANINPSDCCLKTNDRKFPYNRIKGYHHQDFLGGCNVHAVVFTTHKNRRICSPPKSDWVKKYIFCLNNKKKTC